MILALVLSACPISALAYSKLEKGMSGDDVRNMQLALRSLGYSIEADGKYGSATVNVVKSFQRVHKLKTDGVAGDETLTLLYTLAPSFAPAANIAHPQPTLAPQTQAGDRIATVVTTGGSLNLRQSANSAAKVIGTIPNGDKVIVTQQGNAWASVIYNGQSGYVMTRYLSFSAWSPTVQPVVLPTVQPTALPSAAPLPTAAPGGAVQAMVVTSGGSLNLRERGDSGARVITTIPYGAWVTVNARGDAWSAVVYNGVAGYVMSRYLSFGAVIPTVQPTAAPTVQPTQAPIVPVYGETAYVSTTGGTLNLRERASASAKVLIRIPNGSALTVTERGGVWCAVYYQGVSGYVMTSFLTFSGGVQPTAVPTAAPTPAPQYPASGQALVTTSGGSVNLRAEMSTSSRVIAAIPNASAVTVHLRGETWSSVTYNGSSGYVMSKYLTFLGGTAVPTGDPNAEEDDPSTFTRTLKKGMTGADVTWVQNRLLELGYTLQATNVYDDATFSAVKAFQTQNGLTADGMAGSQTFLILKSASARGAGAAPLTYTTLRVDNTGDGVKQLQTDLKALGYPVTVSGTYDTDTHNAVVAFQQRNGLVISGIADSLTRQVLHSGGGKPYSTPVETLPASEGWISGPSVSELKLLHWQNEIKPTVKAGQSILVFDPNTHLSWRLVFYSLGRHADSQPASWRDTQIMNRSFGDTSWTIHPVYVQLPSGQWTLATMHNRPHLYGTITDNGFGGHLCVHFLRDMSEAQKNDPSYGVNNQVTLRNAWKALTGETVN